MTEAMLLAHASATWFMTGLAWFVQVVHYPLLAQVGEAQRARYAVSHQRRTTLIVGPAMLIEAGCAAWLIAGGSGPAALLWPGAALLGGIWALTFAVLVPLHARLAASGEPRAIAGLVRWNAARTALWTLRAVLATMLIACDA